MVAVALVAPGCVQQQRFRFVPATTACFPETADATPVAGPAGQKPSLDCRRAQYKMAFIEFDEKGRMFDPRQEEAARKLLDFEKARATNGTVITVVYVHGWKNNAAEAEPGGKSKDVEKFQGALLELGYRAEQAARAANAPTVPIVGIYMAWRGKTLMGPSWVTFASLWSRRNTANNIGDGPDLAVILNQIIDRTNAGNDNSRVLLDRPFVWRPGARARDRVGEGHALRRTARRQLRPAARRPRALREFGQRLTAGDGAGPGTAGGQTARPSSGFRSHGMQRAPGSRRAHRPRGASRPLPRLSAAGGDYVARRLGHEESASCRQHDQR